MSVILADRNKKTQIIEKLNIDLENSFLTIKKITNDFSKKEEDFKKRIETLHNHNIGLTLGCKICDFEIETTVNVDSMNNYLFDSEFPEKSFDVLENTKKFNSFRSD